MRWVSGIFPEFNILYLLEVLSTTIVVVGGVEAAVALVTNDVVSDPVVAAVVVVVVVVVVVEAVGFVVVMTVVGNVLLINGSLFLALKPLSSAELPLELFALRCPFTLFTFRLLIEFFSFFNNLFLRAASVVTKLFCLFFTSLIAGDLVVVVVVVVAVVA